jgi:hypothetical protein
MKQTANVIASLILIFVMCGCAIYVHPNIEMRFVPDNSVIKINTTHPVAIKNISTNKEENLWGKARAYHYMGKLYDVTETTIGIVKEGLLRNNISIEEKANKILELSVDKIFSDFGSGKYFTVISTLRVKMGNGIEKEYKGVGKFSISPQITRGIEDALVQCVEQMLNDKDIINYLEH